MATAGPNSAGAGATLGGAGNAWSNPGNIVSSNNLDAFVSNMVITETSEILAATIFSFAIPDGSTIDGITVEVEAADTGTSSDAGITLVRLTKNGTSGVGSDLESGTQGLTNTDTYYTWGGVSELWGTTWTVAEVNASTFGVLIQAVGLELDDSGDAFIDHVRITITYTESATEEGLLIGGSLTRGGVLLRGRLVG